MLNTNTPTKSPMMMLKPTLLTKNPGQVSKLKANTATSIPWATSSSSNTPPESTGTKKPVKSNPVSSKSVPNPSVSPNLLPPPNLPPDPNPLPGPCLLPGPYLPLHLHLPLNPTMTT